MNVLITSILIQVLLSVFLLLFFVQRKTRSTFLIIYLIVVGSDFLFEYFILNYFGQDFEYLRKFPSSFRMLKGPLLFLYTLRAIGKRVDVRTILLHFIPFLLFFIYNVLVLILLFIDQNFDSKLVQLYGVIFGRFYFYYWIAYLVISISILFFFNTTKNEEVKFLKILLLFILVSVLSHYVAVLFTGLEFEVIYKYYSYLFLMQFAFIIMIILKSNAPEQQLPSGAKYKDTKLSDSDYEAIINKVTSVVRDEDLHLNEGLTLTEVSQKASISRHHITEAFSIYLNTNFYDFINTYRIKESIQLMKNDQSLSISDLFYQSGFKSKSTFYKYFKSQTGTTPSEFKSTL